MTSGDYVPPYRPLYLTLDSIPVERFCRTISIPNDPFWVGLVDGVLSALADAKAWRQFGTLTPEEMADAWLAMLTESDAIEGCPVDFDVRQNPDTPCILEKTVDGGLTWTEFADLQACAPLLSFGAGGLNVGYHTTEGFGSYRVPDGAFIDAPPEQWFEDLTPTTPMLAQTNGKCIAAANAVNVLVTTSHDIATQLVNTVSGQTLALGELETGLALILGTAVAGYVSLALSVFFEGYQALFAATDFDQDSLDAMICLTENNMTGSDGSWDINFSAVRAGMDEAGVSFDVASCFAAILDLIGDNGYNLAAKTTQVTSYDCHDCEGYTHVFDFTMDDGGFEVTPSGSRGTWVSGQGWVATYNSGVGGGRRIEILKTFTDTPVANAVMVYTKSVSSGPNQAAFFSAGAFGASNDNATGTDLMITVTPGGADVDVLYAGLNSGDSAGNTGTVVITSITVTGPGDDPFL